MTRLSLSDEEPGVALANDAAARGAGPFEFARTFVRANRFLLVFAALSSLMGVSVGMALITTSLYAVQLGSSEQMLGLIAGAQSLGVLVMSLPIGLLVDRFGPARLFVFGTLFAGLTYAASLGKALGLQAVFSILAVLSLVGCAAWWPRRT